MKQKREHAANKGAKAPGDTEHEFLVLFPWQPTVTPNPHIAIASDDKIYVADVESDMNGGTLFVTRATRSGDIDLTFRLTQYVEIGFARVLGFLPRDEGSFLVAVTNGVNIIQDAALLDVALVCFTESGELDPTFGEGGMIVHRIPLPESSRASAPSEEASEVAEGGQASGSGSAIAAAEDGSFYCLLGFPDGPFYALIRLQADGRLDTTFNGTGFVTDGEGWGSKRWGASSIVVAADGRVTVVGLIYDVQAIPRRRLAVWRFAPDGSMDRSFGDEGYAFFDADAADVNPETLYQTHFTYAAGLPDDGVVICGYLITRSEDQYQSFGMLASLDASGKPLETFNRGKFLLLSVSERDYQTDFRGGLGVQDDGMFVVGGGVLNSPVTDAELLVARFQPSGILDSTFANGGMKRFKAYGTTVNYMSNLLIDSNGKILVAAAAGPESNPSSMVSFVFQLSGG
ncbi:hypothetical protein [Luteibacter sp. SG786]|uniref:hypothetical protein n=1 Tax=Luteibacter sp. SG786 TaxID=2587130 RepID=UPI00141F4B69|nr:hypothetical protein [Luteibacter sp. SG786]